MLKIERIESFTGIKKDAWDALLESAVNTSIFQTFEYQSIWWKHFGETSKRQLLLLVAIDDGVTVGIAPLMTERIPLVPNPVIKFVGSPVCDYIDFIIVKGREQEIISHFLSYIKKINFIEMNLAFIPEASYTLRSQQVKSFLVDKSPYLDLDKNWDNTYKRLNKTIKKYVARREKAAMKAGKLEFGYVKDREGIDIFLKDYFKIHVKRWRDFSGRYSQFQYENWRNFVREISAIFLEKSYVDLSYLKLNSNIVACHFGFIFNNAFHWYMPTFNPDFARFSPGNIFIMRLLEHSANKGFMRFDFLRGEEPYKAMWTDSTKNLFRCLGYSERPLSNKTGHFYRLIKNFYTSKVKQQIKKIRPIMNIWYKAK
ncbi:MAG: GNAT family N-acetyltransferase [Candidatus Omnitrophota bacterium]|nr:MAG: GNAT family N-acetyltransferase [Candidatus Omnitrophota bacterium]